MSESFNLEEVEALCAAATEGPWHNRYGSIHAGTYGGEGDIAIAQVDTDPYAKDEDAEFIAQARTLLPAALQVIREQHEALRCAAEGDTEHARWALALVNLGSHE